jgi:cytochrome c-type biogenesis protein CcmE
MSDAESSGRNHWIRFAILGIVVALAVGYMVYAAFPGNTRYFLTVGEFMTDQEFRDGRMVRVSGKLLEDSFLRQPDATVSRFQLIDETEGAGVVMNASYIGVMPDLFFNPHSEIILEGRYGPEQVFEAESILVKCPSKYRALEDEQRLSDGI